MAWPLPNDYQTAVQNPRHCFVDAALQAGTPVLNPLGIPKVSSGNFAVVFELEGGGHCYAVKCFTREVAGLQARYAAITAHLAAHPLPCLAPFRYLADGIRIHGAPYPLLTMEWLEGELLHLAVERQVDDGAALRALARAWRDVVRALGQAGIAHGDLQHRNILVCRGRLRLVDYDGMYVPALGRQPPEERGHEHFQHPRRGKDDYGPGLDAFPALVIYLSLLAVAAEPALWRAFHTGENLLLSRDDYLAPGNSAVWRRLAASADPEVRRLSDILAGWCAKAPSALPSLETALASGQPRMDPADWKQLARALGFGKPAKPATRRAAEQPPADPGAVHCPEGHTVQVVELLCYCPRCLEQGRQTALYGWRRAPCGHTIPDHARYCSQCRKKTGW